MLAEAPPRQFVKTRSSGPANAQIMIVGEAPGADEEVVGVPFVGRSGQELDRMLVESGFLPPNLPPKDLASARASTLFLTNVCKYRPPGNKIEDFFLDKNRTKPNELIKEGITELWQDIARIKPRLIIALGNTPLWALTGKNGITKWRGSMLDLSYKDDAGTSRTAMLLPTYHPALILREWSWRSIAVHDLRRAKLAFDQGDWPRITPTFLIRPSFTDVMDCLGTLLRKCNEHSPENPYLLASDLETRKTYIACHALAWSPLDAICIPNLCVERPTGFWTLDEDVAIWAREGELLTHPNVSIVGQNYLYDAQYFARRKGYVPRLRHDTMFMQHVAFPGLPKGLDFLSSMYRKFHVYWKDEGKEWNPKIPEDRYWGYNCTDGIATYESAIALLQVLEAQGLMEQYRFQMSLWEPVLRMMLRGICIDKMLKGRIAAELIEAITDRQQRLEYILGFSINLDSPKQVHALFYNMLGCRVVKNRKTGRPTCDEDALKTFTQREPLLKPITELIVELRALGAMMSNVIQAPLDQDGRIRTSFNPAATETFRFNSSKNAFGGGTNMQNWTKGTEDDE